MSASNYAAWYAAIVSTVVAIAGYISHRQKNAAVLHAIADLHPRELIGASGHDLRVVIRNVGGMPTTVSDVVPMQTAWRCPGWMLGSKVGRKLAGLKPAGGNQLRLSSSRTFVLAAKWRRAAPRVLVLA